MGNLAHDVGSRPYLLVRFFDTEEHRDMFMRGQLYLQELSVFIEEPLPGDGINDKNEGTTTLAPMGGAKIKVTIQDPDGAVIETSGDDETVTGIILESHLIPEAYISSWTIIPNEEFARVDDSDKYEVNNAFLKSVYKTYNQKRFGLIVQLEDLIREFDSIAGTAPHSYSPVFYGDMSEAFEHNPELTTSYGTLFVKNKEFSHQREFRFILFEQQNEESARILNFNPQRVRMIKMDDPFEKAIKISVSSENFEL